MPATTRRFTKEDHKKLKALYKENEDSPENIVNYKGEEFLVSYLRYLVEHLGNTYEKR